MDYITLEDFLRLCVDDTGLKIAIYDFSLKKVVYSGWAVEVDLDYLGRAVHSYDIPDAIGKLTINIYGTNI